MAASRLFFSAAYARLLARGAGSGSGLCSLPELLAGTDLSREALQQRDYLDWELVRCMLHNIDKSGAPRDWPVRFARQLPLVSHGPMGLAALSSPTLGRALEVLAAYHPTRIATVEADLQLDPADASRQLLIVTEMTGDDVHGRQVIEIATQVVLSLVEALVGHRLGNNVEVQFAYPIAESDIGLEAIMGVRCVFDCPRNCVVLPASWLHIASPLYDKATYHANLAKCREQMAELLSMQSDIVAWVRHRIAQVLDGALAGQQLQATLPDLAACAKELHISPRTLSRKLTGQETSYSQLLAEARRQYAVEMLDSSYLPVGEIAGLLGYSDAGNFIRAFKTWHNCTPAEWRKRKTSRLPS